MRKIVSLSVVGLLATSCLAYASPPQATSKVVLSKPKISKALRDAARPLPQLTEPRKMKMRASGEKVPGEDLLKPVPNRNYPFAQRIIDNQVGPDPVLQSTHKNSRGMYRANTVTIGQGFDALGNVTGVAPPDTNADVGPNHIVQTVNVALAVYDKQGNQLLAPTAISELWDGFGGLCETNDNGDPIVLYDSAADRWMISQFAFNGNFTDNHECIAISVTGDPTGAYYLYDFFYSDTKFNDYPHHGVWTDAYYSGVNQFTGNNFTGSGVVAYERDKMLLGQPAQQVIIDLEQSHPTAFTPMPADIDGPFLPPTGTPGIFATADDNGELNIWHFKVDWEDPSASTFEQVANLTVAEYNGAVCGFSRNCVVQPGTSQKLDAIAHRMMFRMAYRNLDGMGNGKLVANHTVVGSESSNSIAGVRWYEIDLDTSGMPTLANNGTYNLDDGNSRWMGSAAMDAVGNIGVAYSVSGPDLAPSIRFSGRLAGDPANVLTIEEQSLKEGEGVQAITNRWGDYSSLSVDPTDDCTMWYTTEYYTAENTNTTGWQTYIGSFKFNDCVAGPRGKIAGKVTQADGTAMENALVNVGAYTVVTDAEGNFEATLPVAEDYDVSAFKYGWVEKSSAGIDVKEDGTTPLNFSLEAATAAALTGKVMDTTLNTPILAEVIVRAPGTTITTMTDPFTGNYSLDLFAGTLVKVTASPVAAGYMASVVDLTPDQTPMQNFETSALANCTAPGYSFPAPALVEDFEGDIPPTGWTIQNVGSSPETWKSTVNYPRGNLAGSGVGMAIDSDAGSTLETSGLLTSPVISADGMDGAKLLFNSWFTTFDGGDVYTIDLKVDDGAWVVVHEMVATNKKERISIDIGSHLTNATNFQVRWNYTATYEWYAVIDDVNIGVRDCLPRDGNFVSGLVQDANTDAAIVGAMVTAGKDTAYSIKLGEDSQYNGYFNVFAASEVTELSVAANNYVSKTVGTDAAGANAPVILDAPRVEIPSALDVTLTMGRTGSEQITIANTGKADADYFSFFTMAPVAAAQDGSLYGTFHPSRRHFGPKNLTELTAEKRRHYMQDRQAPLAYGEVVDFFSIDLVYPWGIGYDQTNSSTWVGELVFGGADKDRAVEYKDGVPTGNEVDLTEATSQSMADMAFNNRTGMFWQVDIGGDKECIREWDPVKKKVTGNEICVGFGVPQLGLAYDPITDTFFAGSWVDNTVHQFTTDGTLLRSVNVNIAVSGLAYNPVTGSLFVMANTASSGVYIYSLDAHTPKFSAKSAIALSEIDLDGDGRLEVPLADHEQSGLAITCDGKLLTPSRSNARILAIDSGESNVCDWKGLSWVSTTSIGTVAAEGSLDLQFSMDASDLKVGTYSAQLVTTANTPYPDKSTIVTLNVTAPDYGTLAVASGVSQVRNGNSVSITVERTGGADFAVSVDYATSDITAIAGTNYTATSGTLTWEDGDSSAKTITVNTTDVGDESNTSFNVLLSNAQGGAVLGRPDANVVIEGDDESGSLGNIAIVFLIMAALRRRFHLH